MFQWRWLRRAVRRHTSPIAEPRANVWRNRLSVAYALFAWQAFGLVLYMIFTGRKDWAAYYGLKDEAEAAKPPAEQWAKILGIGNAKVVQISGFRKVGEYEIHETAEEKEEFKE